jgi:hypothetical protein
MTQLEQMALLIKRCQAQPSFFIENFCIIKHPKAGIIKFKLFKYQRKSIQAYLKYRYTIYRKCRQSGISTLAGAFALWYGMFFSNKKILIVSKRDEDAKEFLKKNVKIPYEHLPDEFKNIYGNPNPEASGGIWNEHSVGFPNGSVIKSLTSSKDTMRSESASLNIIDEAAFMPHMDEMWSGAQPTLQHGGSVIVISTCLGVGNWYHATWDDAEKGQNDFYPIHINWWEMDWEIAYKDEFNGKMRKISPAAGLKKCETKEEIEKWGPYWSPWLEEQYRQLQRKGEAHKFKQEVLAEFIGSGNTVLPANVLKHIETTIDDKYWIVGKVDYVHPVSSDTIQLDFSNELKIWRKPVRPEPDLIENGRVIKPGASGHSYSVGVDFSSGEDEDFSAIVVIDCVTKEQVAELNIKVLPGTIVMMVDYLARWYNNAFVVPERTGIGIPICNSLYYDVAYTNIYRMKTPSGQVSKKLGFPTSPAHKPDLEKALMDHLGEDGIILYSRKLLEQLHIYVHLGNRKTGHTKGPGNHSDLAIALGLALIGIRDAIIADTSTLTPMHNVSNQSPALTAHDTIKVSDFLEKGGVQALLPIAMGRKIDNQTLSPEEELQRFTHQLGGIMLGTKYSNPLMKTRRPIIHKQ